MLRWVTLVVLFVPLVYCHLYGMNEGCFGEIDPDTGNFTEINCLDLDLEFDLEEDDHENPTTSTADRVNGIYYIAAGNNVYGIQISDGTLFSTITYPDYVQSIQGLAYDPRAQKLIAQEVYTKSGSTTSDITITDTVTQVRKTLIKGKPFNRSCVTNPLCSVSASINSFGRKYFLPDTNPAKVIKEQIFVVNLDSTEYSNIHLKHMGDLVEFSNVEWLPSISTFVSISTFDSVEFTEYLDLITIDTEGEVIKESLFDKSADFNHPISATFNKDDGIYYVMTSTPDLTNFHLYSVEIDTWNATVVELEDEKVHFIQYFPETPEQVVVEDDTVGDGVSFESEEEEESSSTVSESADGDDDGSTFMNSSSGTHSGLFALLIILLIAVVVIIIVAAGILFLAWRKGIIGNRVEMV